MSAVLAPRLDYGQDEPTETQLPDHLAAAIKRGELTLQEAERYVVKPHEAPKLRAIPTTVEELPAHLQEIVRSGRCGLAEAARWIVG